MTARVGQGQTLCSTPEEEDANLIDAPISI